MIRPVLTRGRVRKIFPDGASEVIAGGSTRGITDGIGRAAQFNKPGFLLIDENGDLILAQDGDNAHRWTPYKFVSIAIHCSAGSERWSWGPSLSGLCLASRRWWTICGGSASEKSEGKPQIRFIRY